VLAKVPAAKSPKNMDKADKLDKSHKPNKPNKAQLGKYGQNKALKFLCGKGMVFLDCNFRILGGEIDLIMQDGSYIVFVEVKYRRGVGYGLPREAVTPQKQQRIKQTAVHYIDKFIANASESNESSKNNEPNLRFDVVEVLELNGVLYVNHIEDAF